MPEGFSGGIPGQLPEGGAPVPPDASGSVDSSQDSTLPSRDPSQMPGGGFDFSMTGGDSAPSGSSNLIWLAVSVLVLGAGLIIAKLYRY